MLTTLSDAASRLNADFYASLGLEVVELRLPFALSRILSEAANPGEVIPRALDLRDSRQAKRLRTWLSELEEMIDRGTTPTVRREIAKLSTAVRDLVDEDPFGLSGENSKASIGVSFVGVSVTREVGLPRRGKLRKRWRFHLLHELIASSPTNQSLSVSLGKSFGSSISHSWESGTKVLRDFDAQIVTSRGSSILDKRGAD